MIYDLLIIGAGASGVYAGIQSEQLNVLMLDSNREILRKFMLSGNGKANITNDLEIKEMVTNFLGNYKFLYGALKQFGPTQIMAFLKSHRIDFHHQGTRVHLDCTNVNFAKKMMDLLALNKNLVMQFEERVLDVKKTGDVFDVHTNQGDYQARRVILAAGAVSHPEVGACNDGYEIAKSLNHTISRTFPMGLSLMLPRSSTLTTLTGISFKQVRAQLYDNKKVVYDETNDLLITHYGLSGPLMKRLTSYMSYYGPQTTAAITFMPEAKVIEELKKFKQLKYCFKALPNNFIAYMYRCLTLNENQETANLKKEERQKIIHFLSHYEINKYKLMAAKTAINTGGGVNLREINPSTMESKIVSNLYIIGEVAGTSALSGGFNLTVCYCTASIAMQAILLAQ